jgi:hypothetical protein
MATASGSEGQIDLEQLWARLRKMDNVVLLRFGRSAAYMSSPAAYWNEPPRQVFVLQLEEARVEWRRRRDRGQATF